jgi:hypothetical protein
MLGRQSVSYSVKYLESLRYASNPNYYEDNQDGDRQGDEHSRQRASENVDSTYR